MLYLCTRIAKESYYGIRNVIRAKRDGFIENGSPKTDIVEYVNSDPADGCLTRGRCKGCIREV